MIVEKSWKVLNLLYKVQCIIGYLERSYVIFGPTLTEGVSTSLAPDFLFAKTFPACFYNYRYQYDVIITIIYIKVKVKVMFTLEQATKSQRGSRGIALLFLYLGARWGGGDQRHAPVTTVKETRCPLYRKLGGPQGQSGRVR